VVVPYVKVLTEVVSRIFNKFGAGVASKPHRTIRNELVHPTDKVQFEEVSECIYQIPCKNCDTVYGGETGKNLGVRVGEHKKEVEVKDISRYTRQSKRSAEEQHNKSAITDHATRENHVIDWDQVKVLRHESDRKTRWIKEAIEICNSKDKCMNHDTGSYFLSTSFDNLLLLCEPARFHGNDTSRRKVDSFSVLKKASGDAKTSTLN